MKPDKPKKDFDTVAWTRARRDALHEKYAHLSTKEFVRTLARDGEESAFGRKLAKKFEQADPSTKKATEHG